MGNKANRRARREDKRRIKAGEDPSSYNPFQQSTPKQRKQQGPIQARTEAQGYFLSNIYSKDITYGIGPAGTGKTYVAAAAAADEMRDNAIEQIIVCRPMQACDEEMGFLPGTQEEKYDPWIQPVQDVFNERLGKSHVEGLTKSGRIQYLPLMTMRGKSFKDAWIILDEAQNTTPEQMKMFLTRIGEGCKMIISGDVKQSDLKDGRGIMQRNGLEDSLCRIERLPQVGVTEFTVDDIVRHGIIRDILREYD